MAQPFRSSVLSMRGLGIASNHIQRRQFSRILPLCAIPNQQQSVQARQPAQPRLVQDKEEAMFHAYKERNDFGLLPDTFIMPTRGMRPNIMSKEFFKLLGIRFYRHTRDFLAVLYYKFRSIKPRPQIRFRATKAAAIGLHRQMYDAFAAGDQTTIKTICAEGIRDTMLRRIRNRKPGETFKWEIVKEGRAKVVSHRAAPLPMENCGVRQAVVRIKSTQMLARFDKNGNVLAGTGRPKLQVEYIVIQKKTWQGKDQRWKIWGTTNETTLAQIERERDENMAKYT